MTFSLFCGIIYITLKGEGWEPRKELPPHRLQFETSVEANREQSSTAPARFYDFISQVTETPVTIDANRFINYTLIGNRNATEIFMSKSLDNAIARFQAITSEIFDNGLQAIAAINVSLGIIADAENQARAETRAADFTNCKACQSGLVPFLKDTPHADDDAINSVVKTLWENCQSCIAEYREYADNILCPHGIRNWENCETCLEEWAEANAPDDEVLDAPSNWEVQNGL